MSVPGRRCDLCSLQWQEAGPGIAFLRAVSLGQVVPGTFHSSTWSLLRSPEELNNKAKKNIITVHVTLENIMSTKQVSIILQKHRFDGLHILIGVNDEVNKENILVVPRYGFKYDLVD